jgi:hypothetical protein
MQLKFVDSIEGLVLLFFFFKERVFVFPTIVFQVPLLDSFTTGVSGASPTGCLVPLLTRQDVGNRAVSTLYPFCSLRDETSFQLLEYRCLAEETSKHTLPLEADFSPLEVVLKLWELRVVGCRLDPDLMGREIETPSSAVISHAGVGAQIQCKIASPHTKFNIFILLAKGLRVSTIPPARGEVLCEDTPILGLPLVAIENHLHAHRGSHTVIFQRAAVEVDLYHVRILKIILCEDFRNRVRRCRSAESWHNPSM